MIYSLLIKKGAIRSLQPLLISFALFFLFNETIFAGYKPLFNLVPSPASTFACVNRTSTIATSTSKFIFHTVLH